MKVKNKRSQVNRGAYASKVVEVCLYVGVGKGDSWKVMTTAVDKRGSVVWEIFSAKSSA